MVSFIYPRAPHLMPGKVQGPQSRITSSLLSIFSSIYTSLFPPLQQKPSPRNPTTLPIETLFKWFLQRDRPLPSFFYAYTSHAHLLWSGSNSISSPRPAWPLRRTAILPSSYLPSALLYYAFGYMFSWLLTCLGQDLGGTEECVCQ